MPDERLPVVMDIAEQETAIEHVTVLVLEALSVTVRLKVEVCTALGVPLTRPVDGVRARLAGRLPLVIEYV